MGDQDPTTALVDFASTLAEAVDLIQSAASTPLKAHILLLRATLAYIPFAVNEKYAQKLSPEAIYSIEVELNVIHGFLFLIAPEEDFKLGGYETTDNPAVVALKTIKTVILLADIRDKVAGSASKLLYMFNLYGLFPYPLAFKTKPELRSVTYNEAFLQALLEGFQNNATQLKYSGDIEGDDDEIDVFDFSWRPADLETLDLGQVISVFESASTTLVKYTAQGYLSNSAAIEEIVTELSGIIKAKADWLFKTKLRNADEMAQTIDECLMRAIYTQDIEKGKMKLDTNVDKSKVLGTGTFGDVLQGKMMNTDIAFKYLSYPDTIAKALGADAKGELISEVRYLWKITNNRHIVNILGSLMVEDNFFILLQKIDFSLQIFAAEKPKEVQGKNGAKLAAKILKGLEYLHKKNIIHGDLNPSSVLISGTTSGFTTKLSDFGLSHAKADLNKAGHGRLLKSYMAPEVRAYNELSKASDIFSFGLVYFFMCENAEPFADSKMRNENNYDELASLKLGYRKTPEPAKALIEKATVVQPWERPSSTTVAVDLKNVFTAQTVAAPVPPAQNARRISAKFAPKSPPIRQSTQGMENSSAAEGVIVGGFLSGGLRTSIRKNPSRNSARYSTTSRRSVVLSQQRFDFLNSINFASNPSDGVRVVKTMRNFADDAEIQLKCMVAIMALSEHKKNNTILMRQGAGICTLEAMKMNLDEIAIQDNGLLTLLSLASNPHTEEADALVKLGAIEVVKDAFDKYSSNPFIVRNACATLSNLTFITYGTRSALAYTTSFAEQLLDVFVAMKTEEDALEEIIFLLTSIQMFFVLKKERNMRRKMSDKVLDLGDLKKDTLKLVAETLRRYGNNAEILTSGFKLLAGLCTLEKDNKRKAYLLNKQDMIFFVAQKLQSFKDDGAVCGGAIMLLSRLAEDKSCHKKMLQKRVFPLVFNSMKTFHGKEDTNLHFSGLILLDQLVQTKWIAKKISPAAKKIIKFSQTIKFKKQDGIEEIAKSAENKYKHLKNRFFFF